MSWISRVSAEDVLDEIMDMCVTEHDCNMCLYICETHGIDPTHLVSHWRAQLGSVYDEASETMLQALCMELRIRQESNVYLSQRMHEAITHVHTESGNGPT